jgi:hypothetical protein
MAEFSINNPNGYLAGPLGSFRVYGADGRLKAIGAGGGGGATWGTITGDILNQTDLINYISSQTGSGFVPETRTLTINGTTYDLSADRTWTLPTGGTVTDVTGTGTVSGLTLTGTGTTSVTLTLGGSLVLVASDITTALGYTPYSDTNPAGFINQTTADGLYYPLTANPSNYVTSSSLTTILSNYLTTSAAASTYLTIANAATTYQPIFTTQNGLTYGGGLLKLGGNLTEDTTISGVNATYRLYLQRLLELKLNADDGSNSTEVNLTPTQMQVKTPLYGSKTTGDVLTLKDPVTGEVEFETPSTGGGSIPFAIASGTDTYTATVTGATAYADGDAYIIRFTNGNTDQATLNIYDGTSFLGAKILYKNNDGPLIGGDVWDGAEMICIYNLAIDGFSCIGTSPNTLYAYVTNANGSTITKGQAVIAFGGTGNRITVKLAQANNDANSAQTIGFVFSTSIADNQKGIIIIQGYFTGLSLFPTATWNDGDPVYLSPTTPGGVTKTKPYAPNHLVYLGVVATANNGSAGRMYVRVQNGYELDELHNVQAQTPSLNDTLWYDNSVSPGQWKTASIPTILGYTPANIASPAFTGTPTAPTATAGTNNTQIATTAYVDSATGVALSAYSMRANNTAASALASSFTFKDLGEQTLPVTPSWGGTAPTGGTLRYRWFQIGNVVHFNFAFTYTGAGTSNVNINFDHPSDMPVPVIFSGITATVTFLYRYLSYVATTTNTNPPTGWYGGLKRTATTPSTTYGWQFSGASIAATSWAASGTYFT